MRPDPLIAPSDAAWRERSLSLIERHYRCCDPAGDRVRGLLTPMRGIGVMSWTGAATGSARIFYGSTTVYFTTVGTYTITVTAPVTLTFIGIASGGGGGAYDGVQSGGGGGGAGAYTTGTAVALSPGNTYTLVIPAAGTSTVSGSALTFVNTTTSTTLVSLGGGQAHNSDTVHGAGGVAVTGSNLHNGADGGDGGVISSTPGSPGVTDTNAAGGGGGGGSGNTLGDVGGAGKDEAGQATVSDGAGSTNGGRGGGSDFNGVKCGFGGGGQSGHGTLGPSAGGQGAAKFTA